MREELYNVQYLSWDWDYDELRTKCKKPVQGQNVTGFFLLPPQWKQFKIWKTEYSLYMYKIAYILKKTV